MRRTTLGLAIVALSAGALSPALAEPYIALQNGLGCSACHVNRTGGGLRTSFGSGVGRQSLPWDKLDASALWDGAILDRARVGADLRAAYVGTRPAGEPFLGEYDVTSANFYLAIDVIPERLTLYVDEAVEGGATSREVFALVRPNDSSLYVKAGRFFLPYGLRLQDDDAFTRRVTGFNFDESDTGVEVGAEPGDWSFAISATNGTSGGSERDNGKMFTGSAAFIRKRFRAGISASSNDLAGPTRRNVVGVFGGFRAGPIVGLAEWSTIRDDVAGEPQVDSRVSHAELYWTPQRGLTLRAFYGEHEPDSDRSELTREQYGYGIDWTPWPGLQGRIYYRLRHGPARVSGSRDDQVVIEAHVYF